jgi:hypothetical protein
MRLFGGIRQYRPNSRPKQNIRYCQTAKSLVSVKVEYSGFGRSLDSAIIFTFDHEVQLVQCREGTIGPHNYILFISISIKYTLPFTIALKEGWLWRRHQKYDFDRRQLCRQATDRPKGKKFFPEHLTDDVTAESSMTSLLLSQTPVSSCFFLSLSLSLPLSLSLSLSLSLFLSLIAAFERAYTASARKEDEEKVE